LILSVNKDLLIFLRLFVVVIERLDRDISGVRSGIIGVGSGEEEEANRRRKESTRRDGLLRQRADRETVCSDSERIETPFYREGRVIGRRQLTDEARRSAETAEDSSQHTGKILGVVGLGRREESGVAAEFGAAIVFLSYFLLIVSL